MFLGDDGEVREVPPLRGLRRAERGAMVMTSLGAAGSGLEDGTGPAPAADAAEAEAEAATEALVRRLRHEDWLARRHLDAAASRSAPGQAARGGPGPNEHRCKVRIQAQNQRVAEPARQVELARGIVKAGLAQSARFSRRGARRRRARGAVLGAELARLVGPRD